MKIAHSEMAIEPASPVNYGRIQELADRLIAEGCALSCACDKYPRRPCVCGWVWSFHHETWCCICGGVCEMEYQSMVSRRLELDLALEDVRQSGDYRKLHELRSRP